MSSIGNIKQELSKTIVGQEHIIDHLLVGILCEGHVLLESLPGLAKTTMVNALSQTLGLTFKRVQFTPDLLPSDIIGLQLFDRKSEEFRTKKGPIFTHILLADEINRAPAKVQSALLEAMQERQVTIADETFPLPTPFCVMATQNPLEHEGVYPLPEAQLDRFMLKLLLTYPTADEELRIAQRVSQEKMTPLNSMVSQDELYRMRQEVKQIHCDEEVERYCIQLVLSTRKPEMFGAFHLTQLIQYGASPRASIDLLKASKAMAYIEGSSYVTPVHIAKIAKEIMRHRISLTYDALSQEITTDTVIETLLQHVPLP